jgi:hypothetical protein
MENFNKNWLAILLIVIVFFMLGFLTGRVTGHHHEHGRMMKEKIIRHNGKDMVIDSDEDEITVKVDTIKNDGKNIEVKVEKKVKK